MKGQQCSLEKLAKVSLQRAKTAATHIKIGNFEAKTEEISMKWLFF
jgi:hypothetical protein